MIMMDPETYYECYLKGRSKEELIQRIRSLKREINHIIFRLEAPAVVKLKYDISSCDMSPEVCEHYLEKAIQAYKESGGIYKPTRAELKVIDFDKNIPAIKEIAFKINNDITGTETKKFTISGDNVSFSIEHISPEGIIISKDDSELPKINKSNLLTKIRFFEIGKWHTYYSSERYHVVLNKGYDWSVKFSYSNGHKPYRFRGSRIYPYNFLDFAMMFDIDIYGMKETLCRLGAWFCYDDLSGMMLELAFKKYGKKK